MDWRLVIVGSAILLFIVIMVISANSAEPSETVEEYEEEEIDEIINESPIEDVAVISYAIQNSVSPTSAIVAVTGTESSSTGTSSAGTSSAGTSSAGTSSAGTSSSGTSSAGTSSTGISSAGTSSTDSGLPASYDSTASNTGSSNTSGYELLDDSPTTSSNVNGGISDYPDSTPINDCTVTDWSVWSGCSSCMKISRNANETRSRKVLIDGVCKDESESRSCDYTNCSPWYKFTNTYISDNEYISRSRLPDEKSCYELCETEPNCAGVYIYNGPETEIYGADARNECSLVAKDKLNLLYSRRGSMDRFNPDNRIVYINYTRAGDQFQEIGTPI